MKRLLSTIFAIAACAVVCRAQDHSYELQPQNVTPKDTVKVLCIGNSFTYFFDTYNMLTEIAWSQGHFIKAKNSCPGGYSFACHLAEPKSLRLFETRDESKHIIFLQNQSQLNAFVGRDSKRFAFAVKDAQELTGRIKAYIPEGRCVFESTWAYPSYDCGSFGTMEAFDEAMMKGTKMIAKKCKAEVSPISVAFAICRDKHPEINLLYTDKHHPSKEGAYLKSCVNYLVIYGGEFAPETSTCGIEKGVALKLQNAAIEAMKSFRK